MTRIPNAEAMCLSRHPRTTCSNQQPDLIRKFHPFANCQLEAALSRQAKLLRRPPAQLSTGDTGPAAADWAIRGSPRLGTAQAPRGRRSERCSGPPGLAGFRFRTSKASASHRWQGPSSQARELRGMCRAAYVRLSCLNCRRAESTLQLAGAIGNVGMNPEVP